MMSPILTERIKQPWEDEYRRRLNEILSQRLGPIATELSSLQSTFNAVCERLVDQARASAASEVEEVESHLRHLISEFELTHRAEKDELRNELARQGEDLATRSGDTAALNASIAEIDRQRSQSDTLSALLDSTMRFSERAAIFVTRKDDVLGWKARGFVEHDGDQEETLSRLREQVLPYLEESILRMATVSPESPASNDGRAVAIIPLVIRNKASATLYADAASHLGLDVHALEALTLATSMAIELLPVHRRFEGLDQSPKARSYSTSTGPVLTSAFLPTSVAEPEPTPATAPVEAPVQTEPLTESLEKEPDPEVTIDTVKIFAYDESPAHEQHLLEAAHIAEPAALLEPAHSPDVAPAEAAPDETVSTSTDPVRAHSDARRFARFLVAEIKLYNPAKVEEGLRKSDLYDRLKDEIELRRAIYDRHVDETVTSECDYFQDELVMNLADGDSQKLGSG